MVEDEIKSSMGIFDPFSVWQALGDGSLYAYCLLYPLLPPFTMVAVTIVYHGDGSGRSLCRRYYHAY